jgi:hypothetical protein
MMLTINLAIEPDSHTIRGSAWLATTDGYSARSRTGAAYALARTLVDAGVLDQPVRVAQAGIAGYVTYRSLHRMAALTIAESRTQPIHLVRWNAAGDVWAKTGVKGDEASPIA